MDNDNSHGRHGTFGHTPVAEPEKTTLAGEWMGNALIVDDSATTGNLLVYRQDGDENSLVAAFSYCEQGILISYLFAAWLASNFPKGPIDTEAVERFDPNIGALAEINRQQLFGTDEVVMKP